MEEKQDRELVDGCRRGDETAFAALVAKYAKRIFALCYGTVGNPHDAEDLVQETLIKGFRGIDRLRDSNQFFPWIRQIARNLCTDFFRRRKHHEVLMAEPPDQPDPRPAVNTDHLDLHKAIAQLPENLRTPLLFYYFDGRSTRNIAAALELEEATVHTRLSRARKELRRLLSEEETAK